MADRGTVEYTYTQGCRFIGREWRGSRLWPRPQFTQFLAQKSTQLSIYS